MTTYQHKAKPDPEDETECLVCGVKIVGDRHHDEPPPPPEQTALPPVNAPIITGTSNAMGDRAILRGGVEKIGTLRHLVVEAVRRSPSTDDELEVTLNRTHQSVSATTNRLRADGWLEALVLDGMAVTRKTRSGNDAAVWTLTDRAIQRLGDAPGTAWPTGH